MDNLKERTQLSDKFWGGKRYILTLRKARATLKHDNAWHLCKFFSLAKAESYHKRSGSLGTNEMLLRLNGGAKIDDRLSGKAEHI